VIDWSDMDYAKKSLTLHKQKKGKLSLTGTVSVKNKQDLATVYSPGVGAVSSLIAKDSSAVYTHTIKSHTIAVVSDGSAVLGLGNIGPLAALPVMEGKALLFKEFAGLDAFPICLDTQDTEEIIKAVKYLAPTFGGINLEDISAPRCFEIEARLRKELSIPVFHDDQHGTAIVLLAALANALKVVKKKKENISIVINGAGAAAQAVFHLLSSAGFDTAQMYMVDSKGIIGKHRSDLDTYKTFLAKKTNKKKRVGGLSEALAGTDVFIGLSKANTLSKEQVALMNPSPIVFALANPNPEISFEEAQKSDIAVFATGRSDYPNQINNVLVFPGLFKGLLEARVPQVTTAIELAVAYALASLIPTSKLSKTSIVPDPFDKRTVPAIVKAIKKQKMNME
jgi:malate dehydrogenase (oxaloacetate-decarboxylating)